MSAAPATTPPAPIPRARRERRWLPLLGVLAVIAAIEGGATLAGAPTSQAMGPIQVVGGAVRIRPPSGWTAVEPHGAARELELTRGTVTLDVIAVPGPIGLDDLATRYLAEVLHPRVDDLAIGQPDAATLASGVPSLRFGYVGVTDGVLIEGVATFAVGATTGAVFDAYAPKGDLAWAAADLGSTIRGAEVG